MRTRAAGTAPGRRCSTTTRPLLRDGCGGALQLRAAAYDHPDVAVLVAAVQQEYVDRYGGTDATPVDPADFAPPRGFFVVGYAGGEPVASGGWRARDGAAGAPLRDGDVEIKRMYVPAAYRGRGFARAVLAELERTAAAAGHRRAVLETGTRQPEAIALYLSAGYEPMATFGVYRDSSDCLCFAKILPRHRAATAISSGAIRMTGEGCSR